MEDEGEKVIKVMKIKDHENRKQKTQTHADKKTKKQTQITALSLLCRQCATRKKENHTLETSSENMFL